MGYHQAGFEVVGVDIEPQKNYPFKFIQADALELLSDRGILSAFDAIHASPPCQAYANVTNWRGSGENHPDMVSDTRDALEVTGLPYIIENVSEAPIRRDFYLCGSMFGIKVRRHRAFETSWSGPRPMKCGSHQGLLPFMHKGERAYADAMGCTWMTSIEGRQAVPPAYTKYIGGFLMSHLDLLARVS